MRWSGLCGFRGVTMRQEDGHAVCGQGKGNGTDVGAVAGARGVQKESGVKAQGRSWSILEAGCPVTMASRTDLRYA